MQSFEEYLINSHYRSSAVNFRHTPSGIIVDILSDAVMEHDMPLIKKLFTGFLQKDPQILKANITNYARTGYFEINSLCFDTQYDPFLSRLNFLIIDKCIRSNSVFFMGLFSWFLENLLPINLPLVVDAIHKDIIRDLSAENKANINQHMINVYFLYISLKDIIFLEKLLPALFLLSIRSDTVNTLLYFLQKIGCKEHSLATLIKMNGNPYFFLHEAFKVNNMDDSTLELFISLFKEKLYDNDGNNFLHLCNNNNYFQIILPIISDINQRNRDGDTALHKAAVENNLHKAHLLLINGANPDIKNNQGLSFWNIPSTEKTQSLHLYRLYKQFGTILSPPPLIAPQQGPNCAYYAVACASGHHRAWQPHLFKSKYLPARKRDTNPKAELSLRQLRKKLGVATNTGVFKSDEMQRIIGETECNSLVYDINSYQEFISVIRQSLGQNLLLIIPFSFDKLDGKENLSSEEKSPHWAPIVAYAPCDEEHVAPEKQFLLLAQYGRYNSINAKELFDAFYEVKPIFSGYQIFKEAGNNWSKNFGSFIKITKSFKLDYIPRMDLSDFRRKLIVVLPPDYDHTLDHDQQSLRFVT